MTDLLSKHSSWKTIIFAFSFEHEKYVIVYHLKLTISLGLQIYLAANTNSWYLITSFWQVFQEQA